MPTYNIQSKLQIPCCIMNQSNQIRLLYIFAYVLQTHRSSTPIHTTIHSFQHNKVFFATVIYIH